MNGRVSNHSVVLFTGPSLHPDRAKALFSGTVLPPIRRGDLEQLAHSKPAVIGIIDGEFYQSLAVSPKELLPFLDAGVRVYGGSSMGALRAVELRHYGMIGVGRVFRLFSSGILEADDEVAQTYCPSTYRAVSEPLVNMRYVLRAAVRRTVLRRTHAAEIITRMKQVYFPERTRRLLVSIAGEVAGAGTALWLRNFLDNNASNVKEDDARLLIARIQKDIGPTES